MSRDARQERRARALATDTTPGKILALALLANAPIAAGFVLAPLLSRGDPARAQAFVPWVLILTPALACLSLVVHARARPDRRQHRAARMGVVLSGVALLLWAVLLALTLAR
ncbi:MAG TPA: hypothetical protein VNX21_07565 [Candidatus Thermoplasmatota archaeon]|nr:hypothetical protein [Candidatus Thermoplasmatota archaeon]